MSVQPSDAPADRALLLRYLHGQDMEAFRIIVERHQGDLLRTASAILGDAESAQDAVQEGFLRLVREAPRLAAEDRGSSLGGWLCTVVRHQCIDQLRKHAPQPLTTDPAQEPSAGAASQGDPIGDAEAGAVLWRQVASLPPLHRAAVLLRYRDGLSYADIAARLDKTVTHVGVLLHEGLARLRACAHLRQEVAP